MPLQSISIPVSFSKKKGKYIAYTPVLDISTDGKTLKEAQINFDELVSIFFEELEAMGTTEEALLSLGWQK